MAASDCLGSGGNTELAIEVLGVALDGIKRKEQLGPNFALRERPCSAMSRDSSRSVSSSTSCPSRRRRAAPRPIRASAAASRRAGGKGNPGVSSLARFVEGGACCASVPDSQLDVG